MHTTIKIAHDDLSALGDTTPAVTIVLCCCCPEHQPTHDMWLALLALAERGSVISFAVRGRDNEDVVDQLVALIIGWRRYGGRLEQLSMVSAMPVLTMGMLPEKQIVRAYTGVMLDHARCSDSVKDILGAAAVVALQSVLDGVVMETGVQA